MANSLALAFDLTARDNASRVFKTVAGNAENTGRRVGKAGDDAGQKFGRGISGGVKLAAGALAGLGLGAALGGMVREAAEAAKIGRLTAAVVKSTGGAANVSAEQVEDLATALSNKSAIDDELIQSGTNVLLTFTKIRNEAGKGNRIFDKAAEATLNMSVALGTDMKSASIQVGKALNDPIKGVTALGRAGVQFTKDQKEQIKTLVETGDTLGAQKIILKELETQFGGAAEAAADPIARLKVVLGNLGEEVGGMLLPAVSRFADFATRTLVPAVQQVVGVIFKGDFTGGPFAEDSWFIGLLFSARDAFIAMKDFAVQAFDILFRGDFTGGPLQEDSWLVSVLFTIRDTIGTVKDGAVQMFDVLFRGDFTGGPLQEDSWLVTTLFDIRNAIKEVVKTFREDIIPAVKDFIAQSDERLKPVLTFTRDRLDEITTSLRENSDGYKELKDSIVELVEAFDAKDFRGLLFVVGVGLKVWAETLETINAALNLMADLIADVVEAAADMKNLSDIILPEVGGDILGGIGGAFGGAKNAVGSLFGGWRANGGPVAAGKAYIVGERGPELMVPNQSGTIVPNGGMSFGDIILRPGSTEGDARAVVRGLQQLGYVHGWA